MCLDTSEPYREYWEDNGEYGIGWKVIVDTQVGWNSLYYSNNGHNNTPYEQWIEAIYRYTTIKSFDKVLYESGFHIFLSEEDAKIYQQAKDSCSVVKKCRYRKVVARGTQIAHSLLTFKVLRELKCIVAKEIFMEKGDIEETCE